MALVADVLDAVREPEDAGRAKLNDWIVTMFPWLNILHRDPLTGIVIPYEDRVHGPAAPPAGIVPQYRQQYRLHSRLIP